MLFNWNWDFNVKYSFVKPFWYGENNDYNTGNTRLKIKNLRSIFVIERCF